MNVAHALAAAFDAFSMVKPFRSSISANIAITVNNTDEKSQKVLYLCRYLIPLLMRYAMRKTEKITGKNSSKICRFFNVSLVSIS